MWKQRKMESERPSKQTDSGTDRGTDKRRKENAPAKGEYVTGYWNKKLMELKEKDNSRYDINLYNCSITIDSPDYKFRSG